MTDPMTISMKMTITRTGILTMTEISTSTGTMTMTVIITMQVNSMINVMSRLNDNDSDNDNGSDQENGSQFSDQYHCHNNDNYKVLSAIRRSINIPRNSNIYVQHLRNIHQMVPCTPFNLLTRIGSLI